MTNLTEQWEKDEIYKGTYYCKSKLDGRECVADFVSNKGLFDCAYNGTLNKGYWEILAPVPSFEQWQAKLEENTKLKELLKLMRSKIKEVYDFNKFEFQIEGIFTKEDIVQIDQVLGEE